MLESRFDPSHAIRFNLARGVVELEGSVQQLLVPVDALLQLARGAGEEALRDFGRRLGTEAGRRVAERLQGRVAEASIETMVDQLGGELALLGLGSLGIERWGRALVLAFEHAPPGNEGAALTGAAVEGAIQRATSRDLRVVVLDRRDEQLRLLVLHPSAADQVRGWVASGTGFADVLARLNTPAGGGS